MVTIFIGFLKNGLSYKGWVSDMVRIFSIRVGDTVTAHSGHQHGCQIISLYEKHK
jgi:hypothetical protein